MFTKSAFALAIILATASGALAATKHPNITALQNAYNSAVVTTVYNPAGAYVGTDPDPAVRFELRRDWGRGQ
jgi:hypothetical protein